MKKILILVIRLYQKFISPLTQPKCRFIPTCSNYSIEAINEYGVITGVYLSVKRIIRCNPLNAGGYDPVPNLKKKV